MSYNQIFSTNISHPSRERILFGPLRLSLPADINYIPALRLLTSFLISLINPTYEELTDAKLLLGESFALLISLNLPESQRASEVEVEMFLTDSLELHGTLTLKLENRLISTIDRGLRELLNQRDEILNLINESEGLRIQLLKGLADKFEIEYSSGALVVKLVKRLRKPVS